MIITVRVIGEGTEENPRRPDIDIRGWQIVEDRVSEMDIELFNTN